MAEVDALKDEVHGLRNEFSALKPLVNEMHANMPRIVLALETLARITERLENNTEDHKRIHFRITENQEDIKGLRVELAEVKKDFTQLNDEHLVCVTTATVRRSDRQESLSTRLKTKIAEKTAEIMITAVLFFLGWLLVYHLGEYPTTAPIIGSAVTRSEDGHEK